MRRLILGCILGFLCFLSGKAQELIISADIRPRLEMRHGFQTLSNANDKAAVFVSQRSRLKLAFSHDPGKLKLGFSLQNVRVWGDVPTLALSDKNDVAIHESWGEILLTKKLSLKLGRQEIIYDDHRIFGSVDWAQQARSHDALLAKYTLDEQHKLDLGFAYNAGEESLFKQTYTVNNYKAFQYVWYHATFKHVALSVLALNNGQVYNKATGEQDIVYSQTLGPKLTVTKNSVKADATFYYQGGKIATKALSAFYLGGNLSYELDSAFTAGLGVEVLSGNDMDGETDKLKSFTPLYGTNHKFNGTMDYFYVGNHIHSVGLIDYFLNLNYRKGKLSAGLSPHFFFAEGVLLNQAGEKMNANLGTEIDFDFAYNISQSIILKGGYSHMFGTKSMELLKAGSSEETNHWAWLMFIFKPQLFTYKNP